MINNQTEPIDGQRWRQPSRPGGILFTNGGLLLTRDFIRENDLWDYRHLRVFFWVSRSRAEFWLQFQREPHANTVEIEPDQYGRGGMVVNAPGFLAGGMSRHWGTQCYEVRAHAHETIFVIALEMRR